MSSLEELKKLVEKLSKDIEELKKDRRKERVMIVEEEVAKGAAPRGLAEEISKTIEAHLADKPDVSLIAIIGLERRNGKTVDSFISIVPLEETLEYPPSRIAKLTTRFSNENRVRIMQVLLKGAKTSSKLSKETGLEGGQLYHHLKELMLSGYVHSVKRGCYALTEKGCIAIRTMTALASIPGIVTPTPEEIEEELRE